MVDYLKLIKGDGRKRITPHQFGIELITSLVEILEQRKPLPEDLDLTGVIQILRHSALACKFESFDPYFQAVLREEWAQMFEVEISND